MIIHKVDDILKDLDNCIINKDPFSLIRFGDGGLKFIYAMLHNEYNQLNQIIYKEGLPREKLLDIFELWGYYARQANYIDSPKIYSTDKFWPRIKGPNKPMNKKTREKFIIWKELYECAEFDNENYCNPEINFLSILKRNKKKNILDIMKDRKICIITTFPKVKDNLTEYNIDTIQIVGHYESQYENSFLNVVETIKEKANEYDLWLVAAGELGRIYSGLIKEEGGRSFDLGFVIEYWIHSEIPIRLQTFLDVCENNKLHMILKEDGLKYKNFI